MFKKDIDVFVYGCSSIGIKLFNAIEEMERKREGDSNCAIDVSNLSANVCYHTDGTQTVCYIDICNQDNNSVEIHKYRSVVVDDCDFSIGVQALQESLEEEFEKFKNKDGQVMEIDGRLYRLTLVKD